CSSGHECSCVGIEHEASTDCLMYAILLKKLPYFQAIRSLLTPLFLFCSLWEFDNGGEPWNFA
ncbi:hypothetical protein, partial [Mesorhizobium sp. M7A.F.Ca.CA.004.12.1.1]|uniref:hypothetical protein n=1 Tax=Mesorhizobium sp. M7A.F.Ca.CA.004.12.1.1 TaxID=2496732 RepID=UPI0019D240F9